MNFKPAVMMFLGSNLVYIACVVSNDTLPNNTTNTNLTPSADAGELNQTNGSRLKVLTQTQTFADGTKYQTSGGLFDTKLGVACYAQKLSDGNIYCAPTMSRVGLVFSDSLCTHRLGGISSNYSQYNSDIIISVDGPAASTTTACEAYNPQSTTYYKLGGKYTGSVIYISQSTYNATTHTYSMQCVSQSLSSNCYYSYYSLGQQIQPSEFVQMTNTVSQ